MSSLPVASRQWSTGTLEDGLACLRTKCPAELVAVGMADSSKNVATELEATT